MKIINNILFFFFFFISIVVFLFTFVGCSVPERLDRLSSVDSGNEGAVDDDPDPDPDPSSDALYDFETNQTADWSVVDSGNQQGFSSLSYDTSSGGNNGSAGCMKIVTSFTGPLGSTNYAKGAVFHRPASPENLTDSYIITSIYIPQSLVDSDPGNPYGVQIYIKSTDSWTWADAGWVDIDSSGWQTFNWDLSVNPPSAGDVTDIREIGIQISQGGSSVNWSGDIFFDDIDWGAFVTGPVPEINVRQDTTNINSGSGSYDFGIFDAGTSSANIVFTIQNIGNVDLTVSSVSLTSGNISDFTLNTSSLDSTINANSSSTFTIKFTPSVIGDRAATVSITNNDSDENPYTFTVEGDGLKPPPSPVTINGTQLSVDGESFYYNGTNQYYLFYKSHNMIDEVMEDANALGLTALRTWGFGDGIDDGFQPSARSYNETTFANLDYIIYKAGQEDVRIILPLVNNWNDFGGMNQYVAWSSTGASVHDDFYTDSDCRAMFKDYISYMLNRVNTYTGVAYKDDPRIMIWELANEPRCESDTTGNTMFAWVEEMAAYIKSIDTMHLVSTGSEGFYNIDGETDWKYSGYEGSSYIRDNSSDYIDIATLHLYPDHWSMTEAEALQWIEEHIDDAHNVLGKPVYIGEFGIQVDRDQPGYNFNDRDRIYTDWFNKCDDLDADGAMFWILSGHQDNGTLYPDYDDFTVYYPEDTSTVNVISSYSVKANAKCGVPF